MIGTNIRPFSSLSGCFRSQPSESASEPPAQAADRPAEGPGPTEDIVSVRKPAFFAAVGGIVGAAGASLIGLATAATVGLLRPEG